jgi:hypothetical protein
MARAPLGLVRLVEDADSGREKRVFLTLKGERFVETMVERGRRFIQKMVVEHMPPDQVGRGIEFLRAGVAAFERANAMNDSKKLQREPRAAVRRMARAKRTATEKSSHTPTANDEREIAVPEAVVS